MDHISVCICTYKRPELLQRLLQALERQETAGRFAFSIVIADNDAQRSAESGVREFAATSTIHTTYCVEPRQSIALARNRAVAHANGEFVAFIDDDEFPDVRWLQRLVEACRNYEASGVVGPVKRYFDAPPPEWIVKGGFYERPTYETGSVITWMMGRTNNVLVKRELFASDEQPFRPEFRTGEDQDFFRRMIENGHRFVWCNDAIAYEVVPPNRWKPGFMARRALLQGTASVLHPTFGIRATVRSAVAVPAYLLLLPVSLIRGQSEFMTILVKLCDHLGRLLAAFGINAIRAPYVTE
jgi:glycosyltransferase involved in cell wall biosynthesis